MLDPLRRTLLNNAAGLAVAAALLLPAAPAAAGREDEFCTALKAMIEAAPSRFRSLRTTTATYEVDGRRRYLSLQTLPESRLCSISIEATSELECDYFTGILPNAERVYARLVRQVATCLRGDSREPPRPYRETNNEVTFRTDNLTDVTIDMSNLFGEVVKVRLSSGARQ